MRNQARFLLIRHWPAASGRAQIKRTTMKLHNTLILIGGAAVALTASCAKSSTATSNEQSKEYIDAWVSMKYPEATQTSVGAYILEDTPGDGAEYNGEAYVFVSYTLASMSGTISSTTEESVAKQVGTYEDGNYYGAQTWYTGNENLSVGIESVLQGMRIGETRKALIPSWLMVFDRKEDPADYIKKTNKSSSTGIYELTLHGFTEDIQADQIARIEKWCDTKYGHLDSLSYGFYYKELAEPADDEAFPSDTTIKINYIGRLLNGQVFDTNIRDTARKYNIYDSSTTYKPASIVWGDSSDDLIFKASGSSSESSVVTGFSKLLWEMRPGGKSAAIFISDYGYGYSGSGDRIPAYAPLEFEVEIVDE